MSSSRGGERHLSLRLDKMKSFYSGEANIWDIGCDHGLLGLSLTSFDSVEQMNLVDPSEDVVKSLKQTIDSYITKSHLIVHQKKGQRLTIESKNNCIFIAGMGGNEIGEIITHLLPQIDSSSQFIISPHRKILELRALLRTLEVHLKNEELIYENEQFYQILVLSPGKGRKVSHFGEDFWPTPLGRNYLEHQKLHFSIHRDESSLNYLSFLQSL